MADGSGKRPLVSGALLNALRKEILARGEGENLGSEQELLQTLKVGRSTLRQAARILEQEQLLIVRRGVRGGYFTRRPDESAVAQSAALFLSLREATLKHAIDVSRMLNAAALHMAAHSTDETGRRALADTVARLKAAPEPLEVREFLTRTAAFRRAVFKLTANPFLELFIGIAWLFGGRTTGADIFRERPDRMAVYEDLQWRQAESVLNGEPDVAAALCNHASRMIETWVKETAPDRPVSAL